jgi:Glyoxalase-like domain
MDIRIQCLCIDTADPGRLATFWQSALGWRRTFGASSTCRPGGPAVTSVRSLR